MWSSILSMQQAKLLRIFIRLNFKISLLQDYSSGGKFNTLANVLKSIDAVFINTKTPFQDNNFHRLLLQIHSHQVCFYSVAYNPQRQYIFGCVFSLLVFPMKLDLSIVSYDRITHEFSHP